MRGSSRGDGESRRSWADTPSRVDPGNLISWPPPHPPPPHFLEQRPAPFPPALPSTSRARLLHTPARQPPLHPREAAASARRLPGSPRPGPSIVQALQPRAQPARHHEVQRPCGKVAQSPGEKGQQPGHQQGRSAHQLGQGGEGGGADKGGGSGFRPDPLANLNLFSGSSPCLSIPPHSSGPLRWPRWLCDPASVYFHLCVFPGLSLSKPRGGGGGVRLQLRT